MNDFWKSYDITHAELGADYRCYPLYGTIHLTELALSLVFIVGAALWYRRSSARTRRRILAGVTALLAADEAALLLGMALTGQWNWSYLPLHLCSINVFVCLYNTLTDQSWCKEELYALCIPGAALAFAGRKILYPGLPARHCSGAVHHVPALGGGGAPGQGPELRRGPGLHQGKPNCTLFAK